MSKVTRFKPTEISPHAVINHLNEILPTIEEIYVVTKDKDGNWEEHHCGDLMGLTFAVLVMHKHALEIL